MDLLQADLYHIPRKCDQCGGVMVYKGIGEYRCEKCNELAYDDYGKVRLYIENHKGATAMEIEDETGVSQKSIRQMLRDAKLEVSQGSKAFMYCESCGTPIRSGTLCIECEMKQHRKLEEQQRKLVHNDIKGYGTAKVAEAGEKRFTRNESKK